MNWDAPTSEPDVRRDNCGTSVSPLASRLTAAKSRIEFTCVSDRPFAFRCSPPRLAPTQLRSATGSNFNRLTRTFTLPILYTCNCTSRGCNPRRSVKSINQAANAATATPSRNPLAVSSAHTLMCSSSRAFAARDRFYPVRFHGFHPQLLAAGVFTAGKWSALKSPQLDACWLIHANPWALE